MRTVEISINGEKLTEETFKEIAKQVMKEETKNPTLDEMKSDLDIYNKIVETLKGKIEEEENKRFEEENHWIEQKVRKIHIKDSMVFGMDDKRHKSKERDLTGSETLTYRREDNKITCILSTELGIFKGIARQHEEDKFNYETGMMLAKIRAEKQMYTELEENIVKVLSND